MIFEIKKNKPCMARFVLVQVKMCKVLLRLKKLIYNQIGNKLVRHKFDCKYCIIYIFKNQ